MKTFFNTYWKTLLFFAVIGLIGGYMTGLFTLEIYPPEMQQQLIAQGMDSQTLALVSAAQNAIYGVVLGALGILMGKKLGLWKDERHVTKKPLLATLIIGVVGGVAMIYADLLVFGK